jgi:hypothetical protein
MAWRRDPATGEWEMIDPMTPDPMTQGMTGQETDPSLRDPLPPSAVEGYSDPAMGLMPLPVQEEASRDYAVPADNADGYTDPDLGTIPLAPRDAAKDWGYNNEDAEAESAWVEAAKDRGSIVRFTPEGVFEVDPNTGEVIGRRPTMYRMN